MKTVTIKGELRDASSKNSARDVRANGLIPAVIYGGDENIHFSTEFNEVKPIVFTPDFKLADIEVNGETHRVFLKDIQFHPVTDEILHLDFLRILDGVKIKVDVPIRFEGESPGVKNGGKLIQSLRKVTIKTTPEHLVDELVADISEIKLNESIRIRDLAVNENIEILNPIGVPVAAVLTPRALMSALDLAAEEAAEAEAEAEAAAEREAAEGDAESGGESGSEESGE